MASSSGSAAQASSAGQSAPRKLRRNAGLLGLMFASTTGMIGSGWLFGAYYAAQLAGPYSLITWLVGAIIILFIALCFAELSPMFPRSGALVHMSHVTHGPALGRVWSWLLFLAYIAVPPVETEAVLTYANNYLPYFIQPHSGELLSTTGFIAGVALLLVFTLFNLLAVRLFLRVNSAITWWKILIPVLVVIALLLTSFHPGNLSAAPDSYDFKGIFIALPLAGVAFSFLGFRNAIDLAGEASNPQRDIPLALIGSITLTTVIYLLLQFAFLMALTPHMIANGWDQLSFEGSAGPFAGLALVSGLSWLAVLLYIDAYVSPGATGMIYVTAGARILTAIGETGTGPRWLTRLNSNGIPWISVGIMWLAGCVFLLPFPAWQKMVGYVTSVTVLTYGIAPVVLLCLRRAARDHERPYYLRGAWVIAPLAFIASNWIIYWVGYETNQFLFSLIFIGFIVYALYYHFIARLPANQFGWSQIAWLLPWFGGLWILSLLGGLDGGLGILSFTTEIWMIAVWSLIVLGIAMATQQSSDDTKQAIYNVLQSDIEEDA